MSTFLFLVLLVLFLIFFAPIFRGYNTLRRAHRDMTDAMRQAQTAAKKAQQTSRKPTYNKNAAEDTRFEEIPNSTADNAAGNSTAGDSGNEQNFNSEPLIEDAQYEEI